VSIRICTLLFLTGYEYSIIFCLSYFVFLLREALLDFSSLLFYRYAVPYGLDDIF
jgi:hypothetical protein